MQVRITDCREAPEELFDQLPLVGTLRRILEGPDRPDYWLVELARPLAWFDRGDEHAISHLILASRFAGVPLAAGVSGVTAGIAVVTDRTLVDAPILDLDQCAYIAVGDCEVVGDDAP